MRVDGGELDRLARETGFPAATLERVMCLHALAEDIAIHPLLGEYLALKGGTALNLFFGPPARLSVDLDFNYVRSAERGTMEADRPAVEAALTMVARGQHYRVQWSRVAHAGRKAFLGHAGDDGRTVRVEVDLNYLHRQPLLPLASGRMWHPGGAPSRELRLMSLEEICAGKICALLDRGLPRDVFDVARLPERAGDVLTSKSFRTVFVAMAGSLPRPLSAYRSLALDRVTEQALKEQLMPMLARAERPSIPDLKDAAALVLAPLLDLRPEEREFSERLQVGELVPELLVPGDLEMAARIGRHPGLLWKAKNSREFAARKAAPEP